MKSLQKRKMNKKLKTRKDYYIAGFKYAGTFLLLLFIGVFLVKIGMYVLEQNNDLYNILLIIVMVILMVIMVVESAYESDKQMGEAE